ncbi:MAG: PEP-CTERM sorting domain-containing protein [Emcibacter sp.]|nr:PEP-CTERM sorting domain-containing protein [Emcibacter sp.]
MKKIYSYSRISKFLAVGMAASLWAASSMMASAADFVFDLIPFTGSPAAVQVTVHQQDNNTLRFTASLESPDTGDLRGIFFHINESLYAPGDLTFAYVSSVDGLAGNPTFLSAFALNSVTNVGGSDNKVTPLGNFDIGFEFGGSGVGGGDWVHSITFDVNAISGNLDLYTFMPVNMTNFMAARVMSLPNGGSSKLSCCGTEVPEPDSSLGLLAFAIGGLLWRRRKTV